MAHLNRIIRLLPRAAWRKIRALILAVLLAATMEGEAAQPAASASSLSHIASQCAASVGSDGFGHSTLATTLVVEDQSAEIWVPCSISLGSGASLSLKNVQLRSRSLIITAETPNVPSTVTIQGSTLTGTSGSDLRIGLFDASDSLVVKDSTLDYPLSIGLMAFSDTNQPGGGGHIEASRTTLKSNGLATDGVAIVAGGSTGIVNLVTVTFETWDPSKVSISAGICKQTQVTGAPAASCGLRPPANPNPIFAPSGFKVDVEPRNGETDSNLNGVFDLGETVVFQPSWSNSGEMPAPATGTITAFTGPSGPTYTVVDGTADYGSIGADETEPCLDAAQCYVLSISKTATSLGLAPLNVSVTETLSTGQVKVWTIPVSF